MEPIKKIIRKPETLVGLVVGILTAIVGCLTCVGTLGGVLGGEIIKSISEQQVVMVPIEFTMTAEAKLTALVPTSTNVPTPPTPTLIPTPKPPFDVIVTIEGGPKQFEPIFPVEYPPLKEITIEVLLADSSIDQCAWSITSEKGSLTPEPQGCTLTFVPSTELDKVFVNVSISTSNGQIKSRNLEFIAQ